MAAATIKANAGSLATALALAAIPVDEKRAKRAAVLGAVHLFGDGERLHVTMTGLAGTIAISIEAESTGETAIPLQKVAALTAAFPADAEVIIRADDDVASVGCGRSKFKLPVFPIADLPARHALGKKTGCVQLDAITTRDLFSRIAFAIETEPTRYYLNGIFLRNDVDGELAAIATDGHRLARLTTPARSTLSTDRTMIIPRELLKSIHRLIGKTTGEITLRRSERLFEIEGMAFRIIGRLIDSKYPETARLIPDKYPNAATTSRARLSESLERFAAVTDPQAPVVHLRWNARDGLHLSSPDGSADGLAADIEGMAEITAQVRYLREMLATMRGDSVTIAAGNKPGGPIIITDPEDGKFLALQMPIHSPGGSG